MDTMPPIETVELKLNVYGITKQISDDLGIHPDNIKVWEARDGLITQYLTVAMKVYLFEEQVLQDRVQWPVDWKEAFKDRWFPKWAKKKWPVRFEGRKWDCRFVYPSIPFEKRQSIKLAKSQTIKFLKEPE